MLKKTFILLLSCFLLLPLLAADKSFRKNASFQGHGGGILQGKFQPPKNGKPVVIMLHGLKSTKKEWVPLAEVLASHGWGYLAYDARGHGDSSKTKNEQGAPKGYAYFGPPGPGYPWERMIDDIGGAIRFLTKEKGIDRKSISLIGASLGANVSLNYASLSRSLQGVILLSPGLVYMGIETEGAIQKLRNIPVLIVSSEADQYAFMSSQKLRKLNSRISLWTDVNPGHGVQMFDENLLSRLFQWLENPK